MTTTFVSRLGAAAVILLALYRCPPLVAASSDSRSDRLEVVIDPDGAAIETEAEAARKVYEKEMAERTARLRAQRPATSGRVPPAPLNPEGDLPPVREAPATIEGADRLRAERASRAAFTPEQLIELADRPERQPEHVRNARPDDPRFMRARLIEARKGRERPGDRSEIEEIDALRREIRSSSNASETVPPAPTAPPAGPVAAARER